MISELLKKHGSDKVIHSYGDFYDSFFNAPTDILEIGVEYGRSIKAWCEAFPNASVDGIDNVDMFEGEKPENFNFILDDVRNVRLDREYDAIIDDGSHKLPDQTWVIRNFVPHLKKGGKMVIEDIQGKGYLDSIMEYIGAIVPDEFTAEVIDLYEVQKWKDDLLIVITRK